MAKARVETYADYAWPGALGALYKRNGLTLSLALAAALALFLVLALAMNGALWGAAWSGKPAGDFYAIFPHNMLAAMFSAVFLCAVFALGMGARRFWRAVLPATSGATVSAPAAAEATHAALRLKYLDGGHGEGFNNEDDAFTLSRRRAHHLTFYGFMLCFAATAVATVYHYAFGWRAPYDLPSLPKLLGALGGVSMMLGAAGLFRFNLRRHPQHGDAAQKPMDLGFIGLLFFAAATGLALWAARGGAAMPLLLALHLGVVMALFLTLPYGKFAHGIYRCAALLRYAVERRQPNRIGVGGE